MLLQSPKREDRGSVPGLTDEPPTFFRTEIKSWVAMAFRALVPMLCCSWSVEFCLSHFASRCNQTSIIGLIRARNPFSSVPFYRTRCSGGNTFASYLQDSKFWGLLRFFRHDRNQQSETAPLFHDVNRFKSVLQTFGISSRLNCVLKIHTYLNHVFLI